MKPPRLWPVCAAVAAVMVSGALSAQTRVAPFPQAKWKAVNDAAREHFRTNNIRGMAVAVGVNGQLVYSNGFGIATPRPDWANGDTVFRLASVSKAVTAILAMMLVDQGKLDIERQTRSYFTVLPAHHNHRLRHLLAHMSGVRHYIENDPVNAQNESFRQMTDASALFAKDRLEFAPGTKFLYSTHAFTLLGAAMERATGRTYGQLIERQIAVPMNLRSLKVEDRSQIDRKRSQLFTNSGKNLAPIQKPDNISWKAPGGGLEASANDLCKLGMSLVAGKILKPATLDRMFTKQPLNDKTTGLYGLGWRVATHLGETVAGHPGEQTGAASYWRIYPRSKVVVVVLTNTRQNDPRTLAVRISEIVIGGTVGGEFGADAGDYDRLSGELRAVHQLPCGADQTERALEGSGHWPGEAACTAGASRSRVRLGSGNAARF